MKTLDKTCKNRTMAFPRQIRAVGLSKTMTVHIVQQIGQKILKTFIIDSVLNEGHVC